ELGYAAGSPTPNPTSGNGDRCPETLDSPSRPGHRQLWGTLQQCTYIEFVAMLACKVPCISLASAAFVHVHLLGNRYLFYLLPSCTDSDFLCTFTTVLLLLSFRKESHIRSRRNT
uniref:Uncharacterized protein n=1 Tax=Accipiter nisus TaxID=211598 RepID=A0A8B9RVA9_9AVES